MLIRPFLVEEWMNAWEDGAKYNIAETCCDSISLEELFQLAGEDGRAFWENFARQRMTYGHIEGRPELLEGICSLYSSLQPGHIIPTHGAAGANHHIFYSLVEPGDRVVSVMPTYQQLYDIPASFGAEVLPLRLKPENGWLPDLDELRGLVADGVKMICINNPNNPTGALMSDAMLRDIVKIASDCGAYLLCDEVYRHLNQADVRSASVADLYERGISISSMSKVFSLAGLRLGWIACRDPQVRKACLSHRDYDLISCGFLDEALGAVALRASDAILARNRALIRKNLAILEAFLAEQPRLSHITPQAGTTSLIAYDAPVDSYAFCRQLYQETGALVTPGDCFGIPGTFRIGYACDTGTLREGLRALGEMMDRLR